MKTNRILLFLVLTLATLLLAGVIVAPVQAEDTPTPTPTETPTPTTTPTPVNSPTPTVTPYAGITWADSTVDLSDAMLDTIADLLHASPPAEAESEIYAATDISGSGTTWNVSLVNLVDVTYPFTDWTLETNVVWAWFVVCEGTEPTWSCDYYEMDPLPEGGSGTEKLRFPWKVGFSALYAITGVHAGAAMLPYSQAVDFMGGDSLGANVMPPIAVAAGDGIITNVCVDSESMAIRVDGGLVSVAYFHLDLGQDLVAGQKVVQGQVLGTIKYGNFGPDNCGVVTINKPDGYHLHFVFLPSTAGFLEIGGCVLNLSTQNFVCNGNTYSKLSYLPNGGDDNDPPVPGQGGVHLWDGIVDLFVQLSKGPSNYLPTQLPIVGYLVQKVSLVIQALMSIGMLVWRTGFTGALLLGLIQSIFTLEISLVVIQILLFIWRGGKTISL